METCDFLFWFGLFSFLVGIIAKLKLLSHLENAVAKALGFINSKLTVTKSNFKAKGSLIYNLLFFLLLVLCLALAAIIIALFFKDHVHHCQVPVFNETSYCWYIPTVLLTIFLICLFLSFFHTPTRRFVAQLKRNRLEIFKLVYWSYFFILIAAWLPLLRALFFPSITNEIISYFLALPFVWMIIYVFGNLIFAFLFGVYSVSWFVIVVTHQTLIRLNAHSDRVIGNLAFIAGFVATVSSYAGICA